MWSGSKNRAPQKLQRYTGSVSIKPFSFSPDSPNRMSGPRWRQIARPEQLPPKGDWLIWYIQAGRGWGKTRTGAEWLYAISRHVPRVAIVAESFGEARDTCIEGESGIKTLYPAVEFHRSLGEL